MQNRHMLLLYLTTSIITAGVTFAYERYQSKQIGLRMISPKCVGATTPLAFISAFFTINPNYLIMNNVNMLMIIANASLFHDPGYLLHV